MDAGRNFQSSNTGCFASTQGAVKLSQLVCLLQPGLCTAIQAQGVVCWQSVPALRAAHLNGVSGWDERAGVPAAERRAFDPRTGAPCHYETDAWISTLDRQPKGSACSSQRLKLQQRDVPVHVVDEQVSRCVERDISVPRAEVHGLPCSARLVISNLHSCQVQALGA